NKLRWTRGAWSSRADAQQLRGAQLESGSDDAASLRQRWPTSGERGGLHILLFAGFEILHVDESLFPLGWSKEDHAQRTQPVRVLEGPFGLFVLENHVHT